MTITRMLLREFLHGKLNFCLCLLTVSAASGVFVALLTVSRVAEKSNAALLRDMGFNILIVPKGTRMERYWSLDFPDAEMPESHAQQLAESDVTAEHFVAKLQHLTVLDGKKVVLTGVLPSLGKIGKGTGKKKPMGYDVPKGEAFAGSSLVAALNLRQDAPVVMLGKELKVTRLLPETGTLDDIRLLANLHDVQAMLSKPGRINSIDALGCRCTAKDDFLGQITREIQKILPDTQVQHYKSIAIARELSRRQEDRRALYIFIAVLLLGACSIAALTYLNVRTRRQEIGLLRALGVGTFKIAWLFLGKVLVYSMLGAGLGFGLGTVASRFFGQGVLQAALEWDPNLLGASLLGAAAIGLAFGALPILHGLLLDPADVLREE